MRITFIRHLPTEWNKAEKLQGRRDIEITSVITERVQKEIAHNQKLLEKLQPFDFILASSLKRTQQTAHLYGFQPEIEALLDELDFGPFEGKPKALLVKEFGNKWINNPKELVLGESIVNLEERIISFLTKYKEAKNLLVFGHGSWIRASLSYEKNGHINHMNRVTVRNNECITLTFHS